MAKNNQENVEKSTVEEVKAEAKPKKPRRTTKKDTTTNKKEDVKKSGEIDLDSILNFKNKTKSTMSFNQNISIANKINELSKAKEVKPSKVINTILTSVVDLENKQCKIAIEEEKEERVQNTYKVDSDVLEVLKTEAKKRNMSFNDYLNKVLEKVFNL
jgi:predicted HicB family RNase H-like nuclease